MLLLIIAIVNLLIFAGLMVFLFDSVFGKLDFLSSQKTAVIVADIIKHRHLEEVKFYDLGSCRGEFVRKLNKNLPRLNILGIDDSNYRTTLARLLSIFRKNLKFQKGDIFKLDTTPANIVFIYLPQELMPDLQNKLQKELKPGSLVISNRVSFPSWQPVQIIEQLFIYQI